MRKKIIVAAAVTGVIGMWAGTALLVKIAPETTPRTNDGDNKSIGIAWLEHDGTLVLDLRRTEDGNQVSMPVWRITPADPQYRSLLEHVGPLRVGEVRPVRPWP